MVPALVVLASGSTRPGAGLSQVVLSFGIPFALVPLVLLTRRRGRDGRAGQPTGTTTAVAAVVGAVVIALNGFLLVDLVAG